jgi:hypothetical protein
MLVVKCVFGRMLVAHSQKSSEHLLLQSLYFTLISRGSEIAIDVVVLFASLALADL